MLLDRMAEQLAVERCATRLYELLLEKLHLRAADDLEATRAVVKRFRDEEAAHFEILCEAIQTLGGDPLTPSSRDQALAFRMSALVQAIKDPGASISQCMSTIFTAELTDRAGWVTLVNLAQALGHDVLVPQLQGALQEEDAQLARITAWLNIPPPKSLHVAA